MGIDSADSTLHTGDSVRLEDLGATPWVVLGGGGLKGLAHVGAWPALTEAGVQPAGIVGTSIGAEVPPALIYLRRELVQGSGG